MKGKSCRIADAACEESLKENVEKNCITSDVLFLEKYTLYLNEGNTKKLFDTLYISLLSFLSFSNKITPSKFV